MRKIMRGIRGVIVWAFIVPVAIIWGCCCIMILISATVMQLTY